MGDNAIVLTVGIERKLAIQAKQVEHMMARVEKRMSKIEAAVTADQQREVQALQAMLRSVTQVDDGTFSGEEEEEVVVVVEPRCGGERVATTPLALRKEATPPYRVPTRRWMAPPSGTDSERRWQP